MLEACVYMGKSRWWLFTDQDTEYASAWEDIMLVSAGVCLKQPVAHWPLYWMTSVGYPLD